MKTSTATKTTVVKATVKAKLSSLLEDAGNLADTIMTVPEDSGFTIAGPQMWTYYGVDGKPDTVFDLEISVPVTGGGELPNGFTLGESESFFCVTHTHNGSWDEFKDVYCKLMNEICSAGKVPTGVSREVYLNCDMGNPANCVTEIQIGVKE